MPLPKLLTEVVTERAKVPAVLFTACTPRPAKRAVVTDTDLVALANEALTWGDCKDASLDEIRKLVEVTP